MHSGLVAHQSEVLDTLVNGQMKEAIESRAIWKDVEADTFIRFCEFAYTGAYEESQPRQLQAKDTAASPSEVGYKHADDSESSWPTRNAKSKRTKKNKSVFDDDMDDTWGERKKDALWRTFAKLHPLPEIKCEETSYTPSDDYSDVFLCHSRVYVFADCYGIERLRTLALHKLRQALTRFELRDNTYRAVVQLVQYTFSETADKGNEGDEDALRMLVSFYVACKAEELWRSAEFRELIRTLPDFPSSFISVLFNRLD